MSRGFGFGIGTLGLGSALPPDNTQVNESLGALVITGTGNQTMHASGASRLGALVEAAIGNQTMHASAAAKIGGLAVSSTAYGWAPTDVSGLVLWVHGDAGVTLNTGNVSAWNDQSGNAHHFTQAVAAKQPLFVSSGLNGHGTVRFAGGLSATAQALSTAAFSQAQPIDLWIVYKNISYVSNAVILTDGSASATPEIFQSTPNGVKEYAGTIIGPDSNMPAGSWGIERFQLNGASSSMTVGNHSATTGNAGTTSTSTGFQLAQYLTGGASNVANGNIEVAEVFMFNTILAGANAASAKAYLQTKYPGANA